MLQALIILLIVILVSIFGVVGRGAPLPPRSRLPPVMTIEELPAGAPVGPPAEPVTATVGGAPHTHNKRVKFSKKRKERRFKKSTKEIIGGDTIGPTFNAGVFRGPP